MNSILLLRQLSRSIPAGLERALCVSASSLGCGLPSQSPSSGVPEQRCAAHSLWDPARLQQSRHYASGSYSSISGRPTPEPWPVLAPIKTSAQHEGKVKLHNGVVRFPPGLQATLDGMALLLSGRAGTLKLDLPQLDPVGLAAFKLLGMERQSGQAAGQSSPAGPIMLVSSPDKDHFQSVLAEINSSIQGCMQGFLVGLTVKGVGYRLEPIEESVSRTKPFFDQGQYDKSNITYPHTKPVSAIRLKVGLSKTVVYPLPPDVRAFSIRPNLMYLYGLQLPRLQQLAQDIRSIRKPNVYTGNGIQLVGETIRLKQRSTRKR